MMDPLTQLHPVLLSAAILVLVILLELNINWNEKSHPLTLFRLIAKAMGDKTANNKGRSGLQQKTSGSIALFVLLMPIIILLATINLFAEYQWFFDGFFLLIALNHQYISRRSEQIIKVLKSEKRALARNILGSMVLRQTENLSKVGTVKASMETRILRFHYQYVCVIFWYLILGGAGALIYRCCYEMSQAWNLKQKHYQEFGKPVAWLTLMMQWVPIRISTLLFTLTLGLSGSIQAVKRLSGKVSNHSLILATFAGALKCELGGPAFYNDKKIRLPKCGTDTLPSAEDARRLGILIIQHQILLGMLTFLGYTSFYFLYQSVVV